MFKLGCAVVAAAVLACGPAGAAVTFDFARVRVSSSAEVGTPLGNCCDAADFASDEQIDEGDVYRTYAASGHAAASLTIDGIPRGTASTDDEGSITFTSASSGVMDYLGAFAVNNLTADAQSYAAFSYLFSYGFIVDRASVLTIDFLNGLNGGVTLPNGQGFSNLGSLSGMGQTTFQLQAPGQYVLTFDRGQLGLQGASVGSASSGVHSRFAFAITDAAAAPEPAAWALMISGFGLAGGALRRRRQAA